MIHTLSRFPFQLPYVGNILKGGVATSASQIGCQSLRLVGNLVFAWLLEPSAFALMALVNGWIIGLQMVTDLGFAPALQRNPKWQENDFQTTAYSLQIMRGITLFTLSLLIAPWMARFFEMPELTLLIGIASFSLIFGGATSIEVHLQSMRKKFINMAIFEFRTQSKAMILCVVLCVTFPSVLWLAAVPLFSSFFRMVESFRLENSHKPMFNWNSVEGIEILKFGGIVLLSSSLHFLSLHLDRFILAKIWSPDLLGVFVVALALAMAPSQWVSQISSKMLMPILATKRHLKNNELLSSIRRWRKLFLAGLSVGLVVFCHASQWLINSFYPSVYRDAAWIIPILVIGLWPMMLCATSDPILYLRDKPWAPVFGNIYRCIHVMSLPLIVSIDPTPIVGVIWIALRDLPFWVCIQIALRRKGFFFTSQDICCSLAFIGLLLLSHTVSPLSLEVTP